MSASEALSRNLRQASDQLQQLRSTIAEVEQQLRLSNELVAELKGSNARLQQRNGELDLRIAELQKQLTGSGVVPSAGLEGGITAVHEDRARLPIAPVVPSHSDRWSTGKPR